MTVLEAQTEDREVLEDVAVRRLRAALRGEESADRARGASVSDLIRPLIERLNRPFLHYCEALITASHGRLAVEGTDLAQDAWAKALRYLAGAGGDRVSTEKHLVNLLRVTAKTRFLDLLEQSKARVTVDLDAGKEDHEGENRGGLGDRLAAPESLPDAFRFVSNGRYQRLVEALFSDESRFRHLCRQPVRRRPRQYQAYVLCQLGDFLRREARTEDTDTGEARIDSGFARLVREYVNQLGIPDDWWAKIEQAVLESPMLLSGEEENGIHTILLDTANTLCQTNLKPGNPLAVLRYEMSAFVSGDSAGNT